MALNSSWERGGAVQSRRFRTLLAQGGSRKCTRDMRLPLVDHREQWGAKKKEGMLKTGERRLREAESAHKSETWNEGRRKARIWHL